MITHKLLWKELDARAEGRLEQEINLVVSISVDEAGETGLWKEDIKFCFFQEYLKIMQQAFILLSVIFLRWADLFF